VSWMWKYETGRGEWQERMQQKRDDLIAVAWRVCPAHRRLTLFDLDEDSKVGQRPLASHSVVGEDRTAWVDQLVHTSAAAVVVAACMHWVAAVVGIAFASAVAVVDAAAWPCNPVAHSHSVDSSRLSNHDTAVDVDVRRLASSVHMHDRVG